MPTQGRVFQVAPRNSLRGPPAPLSLGAVLTYRAIPARLRSRPPALAEGLAVPNGWFQSPIPSGLSPTPGDPLRGPPGVMVASIASP
jgi:hypothetical protein